MSENLDMVVALVGLVLRRQICYGDIYHFHKVLFSLFLFLSWFSKEFLRGKGRLQ